MLNLYCAKGPHPIVCACTACLDGRLIGRRHAVLPLVTQTANHTGSFIHTILVAVVGITVKSAMECVSLPSCSFPATPCAGRRLILYVSQSKVLKKVGRPGQGTTPRRKSGGLVPQRDVRNPRLASVSSFLRPQLGLARGHDTRPLASSQPFLVLAPRRLAGSTPFPAHHCSFQLLFRPVQLPSLVS